MFDHRKIIYAQELSNTVPEQYEIFIGTESLMN